MNLNQFTLLKFHLLTPKTVAMDAAFFDGLASARPEKTAAKSPLVIYAKSQAALKTCIVINQWFIVNLLLKRDFIVFSGFCLNNA